MDNLRYMKGHEQKQQETERSRRELERLRMERSVKERSVNANVAGGAEGQAAASTSRAASACSTHPELMARDREPIQERAGVEVPQDRMRYARVPIFEYLYGQETKVSRKTSEFAALSRHPSPLLHDSRPAIPIEGGGAVRLGHTDRMRAMVHAMSSSVPLPRISPHQNQNSPCDEPALSGHHPCGVAQETPSRHQLLTAPTQSPSPAPKAPAVVPRFKCTIG